MNLLNDLNKNLKKLKDKLISEDISFIDIKVKGVNGTLIFVNDIVDKNAVGELVLRPLQNYSNELDKDKLLECFLFPEKEQIEDFNQVIFSVLDGNAIILIDGFNVAFSFGLKKFEKRPIAEPPTSTVIKGPREGFVESLPVNVSLLRRRIKSADLIFESVNAGKFSNTPIMLCYIKGICNEKLVKKVKDKLKKISLDAIIDSSYVSKFLGEHKNSLFKQMGNTEKPDILTAKILEGRVAIFVDGSPIVLTVPYLLMEDFQSPSDYYNSPYTATFARFLRLFSVIISILLPAFFVASQLFHLQLIPLSFLLTIVNSIKGIPLSPSYEMFFTLVIFEILNEASLRMPKYVGMVVSIVGGLVLGETAVSAGIISAPALMIIAFSGICIYTVPELEKTFSILRLLFLIIGGSVGAYGIMVGVAIITIYLVSFENYETPILAPFSPMVKADLKDGFIKGLRVNSSVRPYSLRSANRKNIKFSRRKNV